MNKAVFFDRDGVINVDSGYTYLPENFVWVEGAKEAIKYLNYKGYLVLVVTNQSGVARGYYTEADVSNLHNWMNQELKRCEAHIDAFYYCPHHPEGTVEQYRTACNCRKPEPGMLLQGIRDWQVDIVSSFMIGDSPRDLEAAKKANLKGYLFNEANLYNFVKKIIEDDEI